MKSRFFFFSLFIFSTVPLFAQLNKPIGILDSPPQPVHLFHHGGFLHVVCNQVDVNFDGVEEVGDRRASIVRYGTDGSVSTTVNMPWNTRCTQRPAFYPIDSTTLAVVVTVDGEIRAYSTDMGTEVAIPWSGISIPEAYALYYCADKDILLCSMRPSYSDPGNVIALSSTGQELYSITVGINPQRILALHPIAGDSVKCVVLCEGLFGSGGSTVHVFSATTGEITHEYEAGDTGNDIAVLGDTLYIVCNGSHEVVMVDYQRGLIAGRLSTNTDGFDGPREIHAFYDQINRPRFVVTTFAGDARLFNPADPTRVIYFDNDAKGEGVLVYGDTLYACRTLGKANYSSETGISIFEFDAATNVVAEEVFKKRKHSASVIVSDFVTIDTTDPVNGIIADLNGRTYAAAATHDGLKLIADVRNLPPGIYTLQAGKGLRVFQKQ